MTSLRSLKDRLSDLEDEETPSEIALSMFVTTINPDGPDGEELPIGAAMRWDRRINRRCSDGIEIYTDADREDFDRRLGRRSTRSPTATESGSTATSSFSTSRGVSRARYRRARPAFASTSAGTSLPSR